VKANTTHDDHINSEGDFIMFTEPQTTTNSPKDTHQELQHKLLELMQQLVPLVSDDVAHAFSSQAATLLKLTSSNSQHLVVPKLVRGGLAPWQSKSITTYVHSNIDKSIQTSQLAAFVRLSTSHFTRAFKASFGVLPSTFVMQQRVQHAKKLLLETHDPICQIALDCGFSDQAHLSKRFRLHVGDTPHSWRRAYSEMTLNRLSA
jgi:AraC family transcriptional regulator